MRINYGSKALALIPVNGVVGQLLRFLLPQLYQVGINSMWFRTFAYPENKLGFVSFTRKPSELNVLHVGKYSYSATSIDATHVKNDVKISIGRYTSIGRNLKIITSGGHLPESISVYPILESNQYDRGDVKIGNDVWIGDDVTVLGNSTVGDGCVIGTKSLVSGHLDDFGIFGGIPAKLIRYRFDESRRRMLSESSWWKLDLNDLKAICKDLSMDDVDGFLSRLHEMLQSK